MSRRPFTLLARLQHTIDAFFDWIVCCFIWTLAHFRRGSSTQFDIVVLADDRIGDNFARMPFYRFLRGAYTKQSIAILTNPALVPVFSKAKIFDEIVALPVSPDRHSIYWLLKGNFRWAYRHSASMVINLVRNYHLGNDRIAKLCNPNTLIEYDNTDQTPHGFPRRYSAPKTIRIPDPIARKVSLFTALVDFAEKLVGKEVSTLLGSSIGQSKVPRQPSEKPTCILAPGAADSKRRWPVERFAAVAKDLAQKIPSLHFQITGSSDETELCQKLMNLLSGLPVENLCGQASLLDMVELCSKANLLIANETGTAHIAAYRECPTLCILGGGDFGSFFPNNMQPTVVSIFHERKCFRCRWNCIDTESCPSTYPCIHEIPVQEVSSKALSLLSKNSN